MQRLKRWLGYETKVLVSPLPRTDCAARLRALTQSEWTLFGSSPVIGRVGDSTLKLRKRPPAMMHNSFQTYLRGALTDEGASTRLTCRFGLHSFVAVFMVFWFGMLWVFASIGLVAWLNHPADFSFLILGLVGPLVMTTFGIGLVAFCRYLARDEQRFLLDLLRDTIRAEEAPPTQTRDYQPAVQR